jgi:hypothetical protein
MAPTARHVAARPLTARASRTPLPPFAAAPLVCRSKSAGARAHRVPMLPRPYLLPAPHFFPFERRFSIGAFSSAAPVTRGRSLLSAAAAPTDPKPTSAPAPSRPCPLRVDRR